MEFETIKVSVEENGIATVTLNRPDKHNAFNSLMIDELTDAAWLLGEDPEVRVVLLRGAGKSFCAGADLDWMVAAADYSEPRNRFDALKLSEMLYTLNTMPVPLIAMVHGNAFGGGAGLIAVADVAIATNNAMFGFSEVRLGLTPATISPYVITAIGQRAARRYFLTGEQFSAENALRVGLIHEVVVNATALEAQARDAAGRILGNGPEAVTAAKDLVFMIAGGHPAEDLRTETAKRIAERRASDEAREGIAAFLEKRKSDWRPGRE